MFMKLLISETSVKKFFNKENVDKGKLGKAIEDLAVSYFRKPSIICDITSLYTNGQYMLLIMTSEYLEFDFESKLMSFIKKFIDIPVFVIITRVDGCNDD